MANVDVRERIFEATYGCVARYGISKTTMEDAARAAGVSRATVYRHFPGGREQLIEETITWEVDRFFIRLAETVAGVSDFAELLEEALLFAHRAVENHEVLQKLLVTEPDRLLPQLNLDAERVLGLVSGFLAPHIPADQLPDGVTASEAADYVARVFLSFISAQGDWDLTDRTQVRQLVHTELLAGLRL